MPSPSFFIVNWGSDAERKSVATRAGSSPLVWGKRAKGASE